MLSEVRKESRTAGAIDHGRCRRSDNGAGVRRDLFRERGVRLVPLQQPPREHRGVRGLRVAHGPSCEGRLQYATGGRGSLDVLCPAGAILGSVRMEGVVNGSAGWESSVFTETGSVLAVCPGALCPRSFTLSTNPLGSTQLILRVRCSFSATCSNHDPLKGAVFAQNIVVNVQDGSSPTVAVTGGDLLSGWRRGTRSLSVSASDNVGIKIDRLLVDGSVREQRVRSCNWTLRAPCPNGAAQLSLDTTRVSDGQHTLSVEAVDPADNVGSQSQTILIDNTPPAAVTAPEVAGGSEWRANNGFSLSWRNPAQAHAPITTVKYRLCPLANAAGDNAGLRRRTTLRRQRHLHPGSGGTSAGRVAGAALARRCRRQRGLADCGRNRASLRQRAAHGRVPRAGSARSRAAAGLSVRCHVGHKSRGHRDPPQGQRGMERARGRARQE
jgi:hypothetical protein